MSRIISSRRQVLTEQDRYGGYGPLQPSERRVSFSDTSAQERAFGERTARAEFEYSSRPAPSAEAIPGVELDSVRYTGRSFGDEIGLVPASKFGSYSAETEVMPRIERTRPESVRERERVTQRPAARPRAAAPAVRADEKASERTEQKAKFSLSAKIMLVVYVTAVLLLAAVVIGTGVAISSANTRLSVLTAERTAVAETVNAQQTELAVLSNETYLKGAAGENGYGEPPAVTQIPPVTLNDPPAYAAPTNGFDRFCDWLSGLFS
jgi:cell division protein FtsL